MKETGVGTGIINGRVFAEKGKQEIADGAVRMMLPALVYAAEKDQTDTPSKDLAWAVMRWLWPAGAFMTEQGKEETAGEDSRTYAMILEKQENDENAVDKNGKLITQNPAAIVKMPKLHEKNIVRLDVDEVAILLDEVESGEKLTKRQQAYHEKTKVRDLAILTLMLGTGIRVSECVGLDMDDVDFKNNGIKIHRKGGKEVIVYFGEEVCEALLNYMEERENITPVEGHANALFLSMQNKRISVRSVENLVKKYSKLVTNLKNITPHKLRSTYGTNLYRETGDIYLVADVLGHKDVNTTKKHYAALEDERRRTAAKYVRLREKRED